MFPENKNPKPVAKFTEKVVEVTRKTSTAIQRALWARKMTHKDSNQPLLQLDVRDQAFLRAALDPEYLNKLLDESYSRRLKEEMPHNTQFENRVWAAIYTKLTNLKSGQSFKFIFQINTTTYFQSYYKRDDGCVLIEIISRNPTQGKTLRSLEAVASIEKVFSNPVGVLVAAITNPEIEIIFAP